MGSGAASTRICPSSRRSGPLLRPPSAPRPRPGSCSDSGSHADQSDGWIPTRMSLGKNAPPTVGVAERFASSSASLTRCCGLIGPRLACSRAHTIFARRARRERLSGRRFANQAKTNITTANAMRDPIRCSFCVGCRDAFIYGDLCRELAGAATDVGSVQRVAPGTIARDLHQRSVVPCDLARRHKRTC